VLRKDDGGVKKCMEYEVEDPRPRGRPKRTWREDGGGGAGVVVVVAAAAAAAVVVLVEEVVVVVVVVVLVLVVVTIMSEYFDHLLILRPSPVFEVGETMHF